MPAINLIIDFLNGVIIVAIVNLISVTSIIITIIIAVKVVNINKHYQFVGREDLRENLKEHASNLSQFLNNFDDNDHQINKELILTEVTVRSLINKSDKQIKQSLRRVTRLIKIYKKNEQTEIELRNIYLELIKVDREISDSMRNRLWEMSR